MSETTKRKNILIVICMVLIAFLPLVASKMFSDAKSMKMHYDDHEQMEAEILRVIPIGSNSQLTKQVMKHNGFTLTKHLSSSLEFEKEESYWPFYFGTFWSADIELKNGNVAGAKVWIEPAD